MTKPIPHPESRLTVLWEVEPYERKDGRRFTQYLCQCVCTKTLKVELSRIRNGHTKSCGCLRREKAREKGLATAHIARAAYQEQCRARRAQHAATQ